MSALHPPWYAYLALAASMTLVGSYVGLSKLLLATFPVFLLAWLRFAIAALAMPHWVKRRPGEAPLSSHDRWLLFLESFLGNFLFSICMLFGVRLSTALAAGVIMAAMPGVVALLSRVFLRERITRRVIAGIACAVAGIALVSLGKTPDAAAAPGAGSLVGNLLLVGRGGLRSQLRGDRQAAHRQRLGQAHQRARQPLGAAAGDAVRPLAGAVVRRSARSTPTTGCCSSSTRSPRACGRCGCG